MLKNIRVLLYIAFLLIPGIAYAQQPPPGGGNFQRDIQSIGGVTGAIEKETRVRKPGEPEKRPEIEEPVVPEEGQEFPKKEVFIKQINFEGNTVISNEEIQKITSGFQNRVILLPELQECAKKITALYRSKGYVTSQAYLPPQKITEGTVKIQILEGRVGEIKVQGEKYFKDYGIRRLINLKKGQVLKVQKLEDSLVRINRNPDVTGRAVLAPSEQKNSTDIVISVKDRFPYHAGYQYDNLGTRSSGRMRQNVIATMNNFSTLNDRMITRFLITERHNLIGVSSSYSLPMDARGDTFNMNFSHVALELGGGLKQFEIRGRSTTFGPSFTFPILMTPKWEVDFNSGFDFITNKTRILATEDSHDEIRALRFGPNISQYDKWGRTVMTNQFSQGFSSFLGASKKIGSDPSHAGAGGQFFDWAAGLARFQRFFFDSVVVLRSSTQVTQFRLLSSEQFRMGGMDSVRGYPEGDYLGDKGITGSAELRFPPYFIPKDWTFFGQKPYESFQLLGFYDVGKGWIQNARPGEIRSKFLEGVGGGLLVDLFGHMTARIYFAEPIGDAPSDNGRFRVHFLLSTEF